MICENCQVLAAQYHITHTDESNNVLEEWNFCEPCKIDFANNLNDDSINYGLENMWS